jgi:hypothetical protein
LSSVVRRPSPLEAPRPQAKANVAPAAATKSNAPPPPVKAAAAAAPAGNEVLPDLGLTPGLEARVVRADDPLRQARERHLQRRDALRDLALARGALRVVTGGRRGAMVAAATISMLAGCTPELDDRSFQIAGPRLLAIAATPAEAEPKAAVTFRSRYVDATGERGAGDLEWALCTARKPLTEQGTVSSACACAWSEIAYETAIIHGFDR